MSERAGERGHVLQALKRIGKLKVGRSPAGRGGNTQQQFMEENSEVGPIENELGKERVRVENSGLD